MIRIGVLAVLTAALIAVGCSSSDSTPAATCVTGASVACTCANGQTGAQVCANGAYGTCSCEGDAATTPTTPTNGIADSGAADADSGTPVVTGTATSTGSLGGKTLTMKDAYFLSDDFASSGSQKLKVKVVDYTGACTLYQSSDDTKQNSAYISLQVEVSTGTVTPMAYTVASGEAEVKTDIYDGTCNATSATATTGTITIATLSATGVTGAFDFLVGADHVSGTFDAPSCTGAGGTTFACVP